MARMVVDPITRIEGHLRIEAVVENGTITDAYSSGTMVRGFEKILKGRDPRDAWAFTERACGVCTTVHALASVRTVEDALGISVPKNAELIRNLMFCTQYVQDHVVHFYHLHALDWVDVVSALSADPDKTAQIATSISSWPKSSPKYFAARTGIRGPESDPMALANWPSDRLREYLPSADTSRMMGLPATCRMAAPAPTSNTVSRNRPKEWRPKMAFSTPSSATSNPIISTNFFPRLSWNTPTGTDSSPNMLNPAKGISVATALLN